MLAVTGTVAGRPADRPAGQERLQLRQFDNPATALGTAAGYLMSRPAFARLAFGTWTRVLAGQISRRHYVFAYDANHVVGFAGWAVANADDAEAWLNGDGRSPADDGRTGDCIAVNAWAVSTPEAHRVLVEHLRRVGPASALSTASAFTATAIRARYDCEPVANRRNRGIRPRLAETGIDECSQTRIWRSAAVTLRPVCNPGAGR